MDSEANNLAVQLQNITMGSTKLMRFSLFLKLPIEIRAMVWRLHWSEPKRHSFDAGAGKESPVTPNPTLLRVNRESRGEILRSHVPIQKFHCGRVKYINPELDTVRFWGSSGSNAFLADDLIIEHGNWCVGKHQIKHLEIKGVEVIPNDLIQQYTRPRRPKQTIDGRMLGRHFRGLETVAILSNGWLRNGWRDGIVRSDRFGQTGALRTFHEALYHEFWLVREKEFPECKIPLLIIHGWPLKKYA